MPEPAAAREPRITIDSPLAAHDFTRWQREPKRSARRPRKPSKGRVATIGEWRARARPLLLPPTGAVPYRDKSPAELVREWKALKRRRSACPPTTRSAASSATA